MTRVAVMGSGSWGTAFAQVMADAGSDVVMHARRGDVAASINETHTNPEYLPGVHLPQTLRAGTEPGEVLSGCDVCVLAVPAQTVRINVESWLADIPSGAIVVSLAKGLELLTSLRMSEVLVSAGIPKERIAVVSGPNLAREIAARQPTATVVAAAEHEAAERVAAACSAPYFRPYTQTDVAGVEIGGVVKNIVALATGCAAGLGMGMNTQASLITRGIAETSRLARAAGAEEATLAGLAGMGDMVATCFSPLSRNRTVGFRMGQGEDLADIMATPHLTAEGVKSCEAVVELAKTYGVEMPIAEHVAQVLSGELTVPQIARSLLNRPTKREGE